MKIRKHFISVTLTLFSLCVVVPVMADGMASVAREFNDDTKSIAAFGCNGASDNNYGTFSLKLEKYNLIIPNAITYERARCGRLKNKTKSVDGCDYRTGSNGRTEWNCTVSVGADCVN